ncbi:kelch domain-containing protein 8A-like [Tubulanus polymorphus]|uniref:kelch domain-containing protein 8A-like n=1 Tax=Tubulanus polymorphus TaxID=672921 RepID=UPI003DA50186
MANGPEYRWQKHGSMPTKRVFSSAVEIGDCFYVIGGCDHTGVPMNCCEKYDSSTKTWTTAANMPTRRAGAAIAAVRNKVIVIGGVCTKQQPLSEVEEFDAETKSWKSLTPLKENLLGVSAILKDGNILCVGGMGVDTCPKNHFLCYRIEENLWQELPPMPTPRYATGIFLVNNKLYVVGGRSGKTPIGAFEMYNFDDKKWHKLPDLPSRRVFPMYIASSTHLYSIGGLNENPTNGFSATCELFDFEKGEWTIGASMPTNRGDAAIGFVNDKVVIAGGLGNAGKPLATVEAYDISTDSWSQLPDMPSTHCSCSFLQYKKCLHVMGGLSVKGPSGYMESLQQCSS